MKNTLKNMSLGKKIGFGYGLAGLILVVAVMTTIIGGSQVEKLQLSLIDLRSPTAHASLRLLNGMNKSLAALRGWIILGKENFIEERKQAWAKWIDPAITELTQFSESWTNAKEIERFKIIKETIARLKKSQKEIEDIAQSIDNTPATKILITKAAPFADNMVAKIAAMLDEEEYLEAAEERKELLAHMANVQGSLGLMRAAFRQYLITGTQENRKKFETLWRENGEKLQALKDHARLFTPAQLEAYKAYNTNRSALEPLINDMLAIRASNEWNLAQAWLAKRADPLVQTIRKELDGMLKDQEILMKQDETDLLTLSNRMQYVEWFLLCFGLFICITAGIGITRIITRPVGQAVEVANRIAQGDLTVQIDIESQDETGQLLEAMKNMVENQRSIIDELAQATNQLSGSSEEMSVVSSQMANTAENMNAQSNTVAASSEQVSSSVGTVAAAAEEASASVNNIAHMTEEMSATFNEVVKFSQNTANNVQEMAVSSEDMSNGIRNVAAAIEEMTASLNEVAKNTAHGSQISQNASERTSDINTRMNALVQSSKQIGKVVEVIKDIADQTNMLALNATIEAAGAGVAGKGFAVVAGEVKELAKQSADATDEIAGQIEEIQNSTNAVVEAIDEISKIIVEIAGINENIASAVEEQTSTASEISNTVTTTASLVKEVSEKASESANLVNEIAKSNSDTSKTAGEVATHIEQLASGIREVAVTTQEAARGVEEIAKNIAKINEASGQTASGAQQSNTSAKELAKMTVTLSEIVNRFQL